MSHHQQKTKTVNRTLLALLLCMGNLGAQAQSFTDTRKFIEVTGSAEMTVQADEVELEIVLVEYDKVNTKVKLDKVESEFQATLRKNGIDPKSVTLDGTQENYWYWWWYYRDQAYKSKTVHVKLAARTNFLKLVEDLNERWVRSISIGERKNKDILKYRRDVKIAAVQAAKEKATYLLESVGEKIGGLLSIQEMPENDGAGRNYWFQQSPASVLSNSVVSAPSSSDGDASVDNVAGIKLRYEVKAKFEIRGN